MYRRLDELVELGLARRARDGKWVRGPRGLVAAAWRTGGYQLRRARLRRYRRERRAWRARLDAWYRPAALIPSPRPPADCPPPSLPAAAPAPAPAEDYGWEHDEPPDDPWPEHLPDTPAPDTPWEMVLQLLEEVLGAVPIDEHGWRLYPRRRRRPARTAAPLTRRRPRLG